VIIVEHIRQIPATEDEIDRICGRFLRLGNKDVLPPVFVSNYKNHDEVFSGGPMADGWTQKADPEAHYFIQNWRWALAEIANVMNVNMRLVTREDYSIWVVDVDGNPYDNKVSTHFIPAFKDEEIANPDPALVGFPIVEKRILPV